MKILFYATYPNQGIGYSKIGNKISNFLASKGHEVVYFGISNFNEPQSKVERYINPKIKFIDALLEEQKIGNNTELYGVNVFTSFIDKEKPDIVLIYNDIIVTSRLYLEIIKYLEFNKKFFKLFSYIDLVYEYERIELLELLYKNSDKIFVFTDFWKKHLKNIFKDFSEIKDIHVFYHGINSETLKIVDKKESKEICGISKDDFVFLNTNRNTYRKANDLTISAFLIFLKKKGLGSDFKLFLNSRIENTQSGYRFISLIKSECIRLRLDHDFVLNNHILHFANVISDEKMNHLFNACDVGMNTCIGEGFGLCNIEHASLGVPQIVSNVCSFKDIFKMVGDITYVEPVTSINISCNMDDHAGLVHFCKAEDIAEKMEEVYNNYKDYKLKYEKFSKHLHRKYDWNVIFEKFHKDFLS